MALTQEAVQQAVDKAIIEYRPKIIEAVGRVEITDSHMVTIAAILHPLLPFPVRVFLKQAKLAEMLINNKERVRGILAG